MRSEVRLGSFPLPRSLPCRHPDAARYSVDSLMALLHPLRHLRSHTRLAVHPFWSSFRQKEKLRGLPLPSLPSLRPLPTFFASSTPAYCAASSGSEDGPSQRLARMAANEISLTRVFTFSS